MNNIEFNNLRYKCLVSQKLHASTFHYFFLIPRYVVTDNYLIIFKTKPYVHTFTDKIPNELVMVGLFALIFGRTFLQFIGSCLVTFVQTGANFVFRRHSAKKGDTFIWQSHYYSIFLHSMEKKVDLVISQG